MMREEQNKLFRGKLVLCLILLSVAGNLFLLLNQREKASVLRMLDDFCAENGSVITDEKMVALSGLWKDGNTNDISWEEYEDNIERAAKYNSAVTASDMASAYCSQMRLEGKAAAFVHEEFQKLDGQVAEAASRELTFFPPVRMELFHSISTNLLFALNLEGIMAAIILTLYSLDFEKSSHTQSTVDSTRKGRTILKDKLFASAAASLICFSIIAATTLLAAACLFPFQTVAGTLISNPMVSLRGVPCMAATSMTVGRYIFLSLGMSSILVVIYGLGSFAVGLRTKNGYFAFGVLTAILGILKVFSMAAPTSTRMFFWSQYNPLDLALKAGTWFLYSANNFSPFGYETGTLLLWFAICAVGCACGLLISKRKKAER